MSHAFYQQLSIVSSAAGANGLRLVSSSGKALSISIPDATQNPYTIVLPSSAPSVAGQTLVANVDGTLFWGSGFDPTKIINLTNTLDTSSAASGALTVVGGVGIGKGLSLGSAFTQATSTYTDVTTAASGTKAQWSYHSIGVPTLSATNSSVTTTSASTLYIGGPPVIGTNQTIGTAYALNVASGNSLFNGTLVTKDHTPLTDNVSGLGTASLRWASIYATNAIVSGTQTLTSSIDSPFNLTLNTAAFAANYTHFATYIKPSMGASECVHIGLGQANSGLNLGYMGFVYNAAGSATNYLTFGLFNADRILNVFSDGVRVTGSLRLTGGFQPTNAAGMIIGADQSNNFKFAPNTGTWNIVAETGTIILQIYNTVAANGTSSGSVVIPTATDSTSATSGALQVGGGVGIAKSITVGGTSYLQSIGGNPQFIDGLSGSNTQLVYPPTGNQILTAVNVTLTNLPYGNGAYYVQASSVIGTFYAWMAFQDKSVDGCWSSASRYSNGSYTGATTTTSNSGAVYAGELIDLALPQAKYITSVTIYPRTNNPNNAPTTFAILGFASGNITGWSTLFVQSTPITWAEGVGQTFTLTNPGQYYYLRIISMTKGATDIYLQFTFSLKASNPYIAILSTLDSTSTGNGALQVAGGAGISKSLYLGSVFAQGGSTYTDNITSASATKAQWAYHSIGAPTLTATNTSVTTTSASTLYIAGPPVASTNNAITNAYALNVAAGNSLFSGSVNTTGASMFTGNLAGDTIARAYPPAGFLTIPAANPPLMVNTVSGAAYGNGTYITSQSSFPFPGFHFAGALNGGGAFSTQVFYNSSGAYTGSTSTTVSGTAYLGEWEQLQYPYPLALKTLTWTGTGVNSCPATFVIAGSNDGSTWTLLYAQTTAITQAQWASPQTWTVNSPAHYTYYRMVLQSSSGNGSYIQSNSQVFSCTREYLVMANPTTVGPTVNPMTSIGGALNVAGDLVLGATSPRIYFPGNGGGTPTLGSRSVGTKLVLYPTLGATSADYALGTDSATLWYSVPDSNAAHKWYAGNSNVMTLSGTGNLSTNQHNPVTDNTSGLGTSSLRWTAVYAVNGTIQTSDANYKTDITSLDADFGLSFIKKLRPVSYKMKSESSGSHSGSTHMGLTAQEVMKAVNDTGFPVEQWAGMVTGQDGMKMMNYSHFIAPLCKAVQELASKVDKLMEHMYRY